jgi:hypothetical protein
VYQPDDAELTWGSCERHGDFVMVARCCGCQTVLCARHVMAAQDCEWAECQRCTYLFTSWQDAAAVLRRIT